jgi:uncharacterized protein (DUF2236 family)
MWCQFCDKNNHNKADCRVIEKLNSRKSTALMPKLDSERSLWLSVSFLKKVMHSKINLNLENFQTVRRALKQTESLLYVFRSIN